MRGCFLDLLHRACSWGVFFFMVKFNGALLRPDIPRPFLKPVPMIDSRARSCTVTVKYIDDASQACAINLKQDLFRFETSDRPRPLQFSKHTGLILKEESNQLQIDLNNLKMFTDQNLMTINQKKTRSEKSTRAYRDMYVSGNLNIFE